MIETVQIDIDMREEPDNWLARSIDQHDAQLARRAGWGANHSLSEIDWHIADSRNTIGRAAADMLDDERGDGHVVLHWEYRSEDPRWDRELRVMVNVIRRDGKKTQFSFTVAKPGTRVQQITPLAHQ